jgi:hypothetical protein
VRNHCEFRIIFDMDRISAGRYIFLFILLFCACTRKPEYSLKSSLVSVLSELDSALISSQNNIPDNPDFGAIWCEHCKLYHTRAAEAMYPFAVRYIITKDSVFLKAPVRLGNWLIRQQLPDGSWKETPEEWTGTTTDQLLMMAQTFPIIREYLTIEEKSEWINSMKIAGDYLTVTMTPEFASINYVATTTASLMVLHKLIPDEKYVLKAKKLAYQVIAKMDDELFITGEGGRVFDEKYGVDLGYNMEMSLWGLVLYAKLADDNYVLDKVVASAKRHLNFVFPDGSIDGSWGIRSNKWTCFGGATSDGIQVLFCMLGDNDNRFYTAAARNIACLKSCMRNGWVGYGPQHWSVMKEAPCIYPTFAKAKNMAMAYAFLKDDPDFYPALPADHNGIEIFPTLNTAIVKTENYAATVTAYGYKDPKGPESKYMYRPTGGAISNLYFKDYGYLTASSQTEYHRWEPMHFPEAGEIKSLTPRIEFRNERGYFTNLYEFDATVTFNEIRDTIHARIFGELKNKRQEAGGIGYNIDYHFFNNGIIKKIHLRYHGTSDTVQIIEPVIEYPETSFKKIDDKNVLITAGKNTVYFSLQKGNAELTLGVDQKDYWWPYPALKAFPIGLNIVPSPSDIENEIDFGYFIR